MGWKMTDKPRTQLANAALVREFCEMEPVPYDRPLSERRLQVYERILRAKEFRPVTWASTTCLETNCTYRVNGKHTSTLLSKMQPLPDFYVTIERYQCDTLNDVASLYNTFDSKLGSRTTNDVNLAFAATIPELKGYPSRLIHLVVSAAAQNKWEEKELSRVPPAEKAEELLSEQDFALWMYQNIIQTTSYKGEGSAKCLMRSPVIRAMHLTFRKAKQASTEFWQAVRDETAPNRENPTRILARYLVRVSLGGGKQSKATTELVSSREVFVKCIHAWNAWRKGEPTNLQYKPAAPIPSVSK